MKLREARVEFTRNVGRLIVKGFELGYEVALNEGADFLTPKDQQTDHVRTGLHTLGLAQDIALYFEGDYLTDSSDYESLGLYWESLHPFCHWGGRFADGNHFSFSDHSIPGCTAPNGDLRR